MFILDELDEAINNIGGKEGNRGTGSNGGNSGIVGKESSEIPFGIVFDKVDEDWFDPQVGKIQDMKGEVLTKDIKIPKESIDRKYCAMKLKGNIYGMIPSNLSLEITVGNKL